MDESVGVFKFDKDTKRTHRYQVTTDDGITGTLYIPKQRSDADLKNTGGIPKRIVLNNARYIKEEE